MKNVSEAFYQGLAAQHNNYIHDDDDDDTDKDDDVGNDDTDNDDRNDVDDLKVALLYAFELSA